MKLSKIEFWEAVEMMAYLIHWHSFEKPSLEYLSDPDNFYKYLEERQERHLWYHMSYSIFGQHPEGKDVEIKIREGKLVEKKVKPEANSASVLNSLGKMIRYREIVTFSPNILNRLILKSGLEITPKDHTPWKPSKDITNLISTDWDVYYCFNNNFIPETKMGIVRSPMKFLPYGIVEFVDWDPTLKSGFETYRGSYSKEKNSQFLILRLTSTIAEKHYHIIINAGEGRSDYMVGQFHCESKMNAGCVVFQKRENTSAPNFFLFDTPDYSIDPNIWSFVKKYGVLTVPLEINSYTKLCEFASKP